VVTAAGWWWLSLPDRTTKQFVGLLNARQFEAAAELVETSNLSFQDIEAMFRYFESRNEDCAASFEPRGRRSLSDIVARRQYFLLALSWVGIVGPSTPPKHSRLYLVIFDGKRLQISPPVSEKEMTSLPPTVTIDELRQASEKRQWNRGALVIPKRDAF
jgi:hypothetical protein